MKALPLLTLALCIVFLGFQQHSLSSRTKTVTTLKTRIAEVKSGGGTGREGGSGPGGSGKSSRTARGTSGSGGADSLADLDLKELAAAMMRSELSGAPDLKAMMRMQSLLLEATPEELQDLITRTAELDVPERLKQNLIGEFIRALSDHDPKAALDLAFRSENVDLDRQQWTFRQSFSKWAMEDPAAAVAWFDQELAKGTFETRSLDGASRVRMEFQRAAIAALLDSDPALARQRLLALPEGERREVLMDGGPFHISEENAVAHADLVRATLPEADRARALAEASCDLLRRMEYAELAAHTTRINATDAERTAILGAAVGRQFERFGWESKTPTADDVTEAQTFLQSQLPADSANRITGESLAKFGRSNQNFAAATALVTELQTAAPNDDFLIGFLEGSDFGSSSTPARRTLAEQISDPVRREEFLSNLK